jgi:transposase
MKTSREEWRKRIERWQQSGLTAEQYASELGINAGTLKFWKYKLGRPEPQEHAATQRKKRTSKAPPLPLVEMRPSVAAEAPGFELGLSDGKRLRIPTSFEPEALSRLLSVLGRTA